MTEPANNLTLLEASVSVDGAISDVDRLIAAVNRMGEAFMRSGATAKKGADDTDEAASKAAIAAGRSAAAAERNLAREIAALKAGGRATAEYYEQIYAKQSATNPLIAKQITELRGLQDAAKAAAAEQKRLADAARAAAAAASLAPATQQLERLGMTAKATSAALRQVPAQFTDIVVSLQGGQAPLTVLLQQGGQLKDVFGGIAPAFRALSNYVVGLINPLTMAAAAIGTIGLAWYKGAAESEAFNKALILTGNYAGLTTTKLVALQTTVAAATGGTKGAAAEALTAFAASGQLASTNYAKFAEVAVRAQKELGTSVGDTVKIFEDLGKEPLKASLKLNESTNYLTLSVYRQIKALEDQGRTADAAAVAQNAYADSTNLRLGKVTENLGYMESALRSVSKGWSIFWDAAKGIGRDADPVDTLTKQIGVLEGRLRNSRTGRIEPGDNQGYFGQRASSELEGLREQLQLLKKVRDSKDAAAAAESENGRSLKAQNEFAQISEKYLTNKVKLTRELGELNTKFAATQEKLAVRARDGDKEAAKQMAENIAARAVSEAKIRDQFKGPAGAKEVGGFAQDQGKAYAKYMEESAAAMLAAQVKTDDLTKSQGALVAMLMDPVFQSMPETWKETALQSKYAAIAQEQNNDASALAAKAAKDATNARRESANGIEKRLEALHDETEAYAVQAEMGVSLAEAIDIVAIARLEEQKVLEGIGGNTGAVAQIEREIALRRQLRTEINRKDAHLAEVAANKEAVKASVDEWKRGWAATDQLGREVFTTWAMDGSSAAQKIGDTLKKALLSAIYEATLKPIAFQIYNAVTGGVPGGGSALGAVGSVAGSASALGGFGASAAASAASIYGAGGSLATLTSAVSVGVEMAVAGEFAAGLGMVAGALGPIGLGVAALASLFKKGEYVQSTGSSVQYFDPTGASTGKTSLENNFVTAEADKYVAGIKDAYTNLIKQFGGTNPGGAFAFASNNSDGGKFGVQVGVGTAKYSTGELKTSPEALTLEASRAVFAALQGSELPRYLAGVFDGLTATTATQDQINKALEYAGTIKAINDQFTVLPAQFANLRDMSLKALESLATFSGGLANLGTNLGTYYEQYFNAEEKRANTIRNITNTLNAAGAGFDEQLVTDVLAQTGEVAKKTFRDIVEAQDLTTEAGRKNYAVMLSVAGAFAGLTGAATTAAAAVDNAAAAINEAWSNEGRRIDAARAVIDSLRAEATQKYIAAQERVVAAQQGVAQALQQTIGSFESFLATLDNASKPTERLAGARANFNDLTARAQAGDLSAVNQLPAAAKSFLDLSKGYSASITDYRRDEAKVRIVLKAGIAAGQEQLAKLPKEIARATDPLVAAYQELEKATKDEFDSRTLAIAMQARLSTAESDLADRYIKATYDLGSDGQVMRDFFYAAKATVAAALKISLAAAEAAQAMLAQLYDSGGYTPTTPPPTNTPTVPTTPVVTTTTPRITAETGTSTVINPVQKAADDAAGKPQTITLSTDPNKYTPGIVGGGVYTGPTGVSITTDGLVRTDGPKGTELFWARDIAAMLNDFSDANGVAAAVSRAAELGVSGSMLDQIRKFSVEVPKFERGINYVPSKMLAQLHPGERVLPAADNTMLMETLRSPKANNDVLVQAVKDLQAEVAQLRAEAEARDMVLIGAAQKTAKISFKWDKDGLPPTRV
jgi:phage-related minor tail protein